MITFILLSVHLVMSLVVWAVYLAGRYYAGNVNALRDLFFVPATIISLPLFNVLALVAIGVELYLNRNKRGKYE